MAKRLNKNLVGGLTIFGMAATFAAGAALVAFLPDKDPGIYIEQAKTQEEKGDLKKATTLYLRAYQVSRDPAYLIDAGRLINEQGNALQAVKMLKKSINENNSNIQAHRQLLSIMVEMARVPGMAQNVRWWTEIQDASERTLQVDAENPAAHHGLGLALMGLRGQTKENEKTGLDELRHAVKLAPNNAEFAGDLSIYLESLKRDPQEIENIYTTLIENNPNDSKSHLIYGEYLSRKSYSLAQEKNLDDARLLRERAKVELEKARDLAPEKPDSYIALGRLTYLTRDEKGYLPEDTLNQALEYFKKATEADKDAYKSYLALGLLYIEQGDYEAGLAVFRERLKVPPVRKGFMERIRRANHFMLLRHATRAALYLAEKSTEDEVKRKEYITEAEEFYKQAKAELMENPLTHQIEGEILLVKREYRGAIQAFENAERMSPSPNPEIKRHLAGLYEKIGADGKAEQTYVEFLDLHRSRGFAAPAQVLLALGRIENRLNKPNRALLLAKEAQDLYPNRDQVITQSRYLEMEAYRQLEKFDRVEEISKLLGTDDIASLKREVQIALMKEDLKTAEQKLRQILKIKPYSSLALRQMVAILLKSNRKEEALQLVNTAIKEKPDKPGLKRLKFALTETSVEERQKAALALIEETEDPILREIELSDFYAGQRTEAGTKEAMNHLRIAEKKLRDPDMVKNYRPGTVDRLVEAVMEKQFVIARSAKDWPQAEAIVGRAIEYNADGVDGLFFEGRLALVQGDADRAAAKLRQGLEKMPNSPQGLQWLGAALLRGGQFSEARTVFENALELSPNNGYAHLGMAQLASANGNEEEKKKHLKECARLIPREPWVKKQMQVLVDEENPEQGIARRVELRKQNPDDLENLTRLAFLYLRTKEFKKGSEIIEAFVQNDPANQDLMLNAANFYRQWNGDKEGKGVALLSKYIQAVKDPDKKAAAQLALAGHLANIGDFKRADEAYKQAGEIAETYEVCVTIGRWMERTRRPQKAVDWFRKSVDSSKKPSAYAWKLLLDTLLNHPSIGNANQDVTRYVKLFPDDFTGLIYEGRIALANGQTNQALEKFTAYIRKRPEEATGYFLRGHVRFLRNEYRDAIVDLERAKSLSPRGFKLQHRLRLARAKENIGQLDQAVDELKSILKENPNAGSIARALSEMYQRHDRHAEQDALLVRYQSLQPKEWYWPLARARLLTKLNRPGPASKSIELAVNRAVDQPRFLAIVMDEVAVMLLKLRAYDRLIKIIETDNLPAETRTPFLWRRLGRAKFLKGDKTAALADFEQALAKANSSHEAYMEVARDMADLFGAEHLLTVFRDRLAKDKNDRQAERLIAEILIAQDNSSSEALAILEKLLASSTDDQERVPLLIRVGIVYYSQKKYDDAVATYEKALEINPNHAFVLNNLAYILAEDMGKPKEALPYALKAANISADANIYDTIGWTYALSKSFDDAIAWLLRAVEMDDSLPVAAWHLAEAYRLNGDKIAAERAVRRAFQLIEDKPKDPYRGPIFETMRQLGIKPPK